MICNKPAQKIGIMFSDLHTVRCLIPRHSFIVDIISFCHLHAHYLLVCMDLLPWVCWFFVQVVATFSLFHFDWVCLVPSPSYPIEKVASY